MCECLYQGWSKCWFLWVMCWLYVNMKYIYLCSLPHVKNRVICTNVIKVFFFYKFLLSFADIGNAAFGASTALSSFLKFLSSRANVSDLPQFCQYQLPDDCYWWLCWWHLHFFSILFIDFMTSSNFCKLQHYFVDHLYCTCILYY